MATLLHALAALVLGNFRFAPFFERAHSVFQIREPGFNHLIRHVATQFFAADCFLRSNLRITPASGLSRLFVYACCLQRLLDLISICHAF